MPDKRCGTCRHWSPIPMAAFGHCAILVSLRSQDCANEDHTGCPGWSSGDEYVRGWRDAVAAAGAIIDDWPEEQDIPWVLPAAIAALEPPG